MLPRDVQILRPNPTAASNSITTSMYTWYTFPTIGVLELLYPWKKFANFYFLCVGLLQMWKAVSLTSGQPSSYFTLTFIMIVELFFKGREDLQRARGDRVTNRQQVEVLAADAGSDEARGAPAFATRSWSDVAVGDVVRVKSRETFPADLLLLRASDPGAGQCWVNTKPLDGETDSKLRVSPKALLPLLDAPGACEPAELRRILRGHVRCEVPNDKVNDITAQLCLDGVAPMLLNEDNFLLRGCQLRNTEWVLALVISTGVQTKINYLPGAEDVGKPKPLKKRLWHGLVGILSGKGAKPKTGRIAHMVNLDIMGVVIWLIVMCLLGGILYTAWEAADAPWYLTENTEGGFEGLVKMTARFFLICYQFVPISLYVSMMMFQTLSRQFVIAELEMYDPDLDEPCQVRQMSLLDELGQVSHIFSDKTGTLTSNHMEFRRCYIFSPEGVAYGCGETAISRSLQAAAASKQRASGVGAAAFEGLSPPTGPKMSTAPLPAFVGCKPTSATYCNYEEEAEKPSLYTALQAKDASGAMCRELMLAMAVNHSVLLEQVGDRLELSASSPDEQAFVAAAEYFGFDFAQRDADRGVLTIVDKQSGARHEVELLHAFPYESSRKRMSVIVRLPPALLAVVGGGAPVRLYTKGADSVLLDQSSGVLAAGSRGSDEASLQSLDALLYEWADVALRTLVFAKREMPDFDEWNAAYERAIADPENVRKCKLKEENEISRLQAQVENGLTLQGATAIEDKLQDGVPEVLADLRAAGIKVWMLTGDKVGTAKNIATACNILPSDAEVLEVTSETFPVLAEVKTSELLAIGKALDALHNKVNRRGSIMGGRRGSVMAPTAKPPPSLVPAAWMEKLMGRKKRKSAAEIKQERDEYMEAVEHHTARLDESYPELTQVRAALHDRQLLMAERLDKTGRVGKSALALPTNLAGAPAAIGAALTTAASALSDCASSAVSAATGKPTLESERPQSSGELCLVLDEMAIEYCGLLCREVLAAVGHGSRSVVACRARKDQKAQLLNLIKEDVPTSCCLAIGDGANDVAMIKAGHIGVGIIGKEGMQAVNNSDFAIAQFRFLRHLLFVHGRFAYKRTSTFCYYMFYKNITNVLAMYVYTLSSMASGNRLFTQTYLEFYNIAFTSFPIIVYAVFDQDVPKSVAASSPMLYTPGIHGTSYTHRSFVLWMVEACYLATLAIYLPAVSLGYPGGSSSTSGGWSLSSPATGDPDMAIISMTAMTLVCIGVNLRLAIEIHSWSWIEHFFMWGTISSIELACLIFSFVWYPDSLAVSYSWNELHGVVVNVWEDFAYWAVCVLVVVFTLAPRMLGKAWSVLFVASASRRARRLAMAVQQRESEQLKKQVKDAEMRMPTMAEMLRYRSTRVAEFIGLAPAASPAAAEPTPVSSPSIGTPLKRRESSRRRESSAFSNDDRSAARVLESVAQHHTSHGAAGVVGDARPTERLSLRGRAQVIPTATLELEQV